MAWQNIQTPAVGTPTRKQFASAVVNNLEYVKGQLDTLTTGAVITNGSFENDTDADGIPDNWTDTTVHSGGSIEQLTTDSVAGAGAVKFTGTGSGGGILTMSDVIEVSGYDPLIISWYQKGTVNVRNIVTIYWYDETLSAASTASDIIFDRQADNPTTWAKMFGGAVPPSDARYAKVEIHGVASTGSTLTGNTWFDEVKIDESPWLREVTIDTAGSFGWVCPAGVYRVLAFCTGAGGGSNGTTNPYYGGGGGGTGADIIDVVPGTAYTAVVGAGTSGAGGSSTFNSSTVGQGGNEWSEFVGGTGGSYTASFWGQDGTDKATTTGGSSAFGLGGAANVNGYRGGGAGGGAGSAKSGGAGLIKLFY